MHYCPNEASYEPLPLIAAAAAPAPFALFLYAEYAATASQVYAAATSRRPAAAAPRPRRHIRPAMPKARRCRHMMRYADAERPGFVHKVDILLTPRRLFNADIAVAEERIRERSVTRERYMLLVRQRG